MITHVARPGGEVGTDINGNPKRASIDSLDSIAKEYGTTWQAVANATYGTADPNKLGGTRVGLVARAGGVKLSSGYWAMPESLQVNVPVDPAKAIQPTQAGMGFGNITSGKLIILLGLGYVAYKVFVTKEWKIPFLRTNPENLGLYCPTCKEFIDESKLTIGKDEIKCDECEESFSYFWKGCNVCEDKTPHTDQIARGDTARSICVRCGTVK